MGGEEGRMASDNTGVINTIETSSVRNVNWETTRLISDRELQEYVRSYLIIRRPDGCDIVSKLSPLEVYSANNLHDLVHCRISGKPPFFPDKKSRSSVTLRVNADAETYLDTAGKSFYITQRGCESFDEHSCHLPSLTMLHDVCRAIVEYGIASG